MSALARTGLPAAEDAIAEAPRNDAGVTLVETLVAMTVFAVLLSVVMASVLGLTRGAVRAQNAADTSSQVTKAFTLLDRQVRYADSVNLPGTTSAGDSYVEFRTSAVAVGSPATCTQWRYRQSTGELQWRTWQDTAAPGSSWSTVVTSAARTAATPFVVTLAGTARTSQSLVVQLSNTRSGSAGTSQLSSTFVARNSSSSSPSNTDVAAPLGVSDSPVCSPAGVRP